MIGIRMDMRAIRGQFLDRQEIMNRYDKAALRGLNRFGSTTRMIARRSMRVRKAKQTIGEFEPELKKLLNENARQSGKNRPDIAPWPLRTARPGQPPFARNRLLKDRIFYIADRKSRSVVIGPQIWAKSGDDMGALEHGGTTNSQARHWVKFYDQGQAKIRLVPKGGRRVRLKARPYMDPAYDATVDRLVPDIWKNSI